jgi:phospholipid-binding lipoprotein MlaA
VLEEAALDKYVFQRDAFLQRRRSLIYDGNPPREIDPEDILDEPAPAAAPADAAARPPAATPPRPAEPGK